MEWNQAFSDGDKDLIPWIYTWHTLQYIRLYETILM